MTVVPEISEKVLAYALGFVRKAIDQTRPRRAAGEGEQQAQKLTLSELMAYCDETNEEKIRAYPGAGTRLQKIVCLAMAAAAVLFALSVFSGTATAASIAIVLSFCGAGLFIYRFFFDGTKLSFLAARRTSANLFGKRYARFEPLRRVVLVTRCDAPQKLRKPIFGSATPNLLTLTGLLGTALLFVCTAVFLFAGAPEKNGFFGFLAVVCALFIPCYVYAAFLADPNEVSAGISEALVPTATALGVLKSLYDRSERYERTEVCLLVSGAEFSARAGSYAFAKKHKKLYSDIPTVFIPIETLTTTKRLSVFFRSGTGSAQAASVVAEAADNLNLRLDRETSPLGSACFTPFAAAGFDSCSVGTSRRLLAKDGEVQSVDEIDKNAVAAMGALLIESLNYFDSYGG